MSRTRAGIALAAAHVVSATSSAAAMLTDDDLHESGAHEALTCLGESATIVGTTGPDVIVARAGDDTIEGRGGGIRADTPFGQEGNDILDGSSGKRDRCIGGRGINTIRRCELNT